MTRTGHVYTPQKTRSAEQRIAEIAKRAMGKLPQFVGAVSVNIAVWQTPPKCWPRKRRMEKVWVTGKPDVDNVQKLIFDALNGIVWKDDAQIAHVLMSRLFSQDGSERLEIEIRELEGA